MKQVDESHYLHTKYQTPERFTSIYYQLQCTLSLRPDSILDIGVGDNSFTALVKNHGIHAYGMDFDIHLEPSLCGDVKQIPLKNNSVDLCTAFQILEHIPFEHLHDIASEMCRVCRTGVVISLPEHGNAGLIVNIPYLRMIRLTIPSVFIMKPRHKFDGQHYWEINKRGFPRSRIIEAFQTAGLEHIENFLNPYNPYHRFFVFRKWASD